MKKYLCILALISLQLACGVASTLPTQPAPEMSMKESVISPEKSEMIVAGLYPDEPLNIRDGAGGTELGIYLKNGDVVEIYQAEWSNDTLWCAITPERTRWVACRYLKGK